jgi:hypothetical protein
VGRGTQSKPGCGGSSIWVMGEEEAQHIDNSMVVDGRPVGNGGAGPVAGSRSSEN